jgi:periplasmic copper chaperone A
MGKITRIDMFCATAVAIILAQVSPILAADYDVGSIHIAQPWSRATPKGATAGAGYMTITNKGTTPDKVSCVSDDASAQCEIHSMTMEGGVMKMRPVEGGLEIKPGETVTLAPSGFHVMFRQLKHPLEQGKTVKATHFQCPERGICERRLRCHHHCSIRYLPPATINPMMTMIAMMKPKKKWPKQPTRR